MLLRRLRTWLDVPHVGPRLALLVVLLGLPSLASGLCVDDFVLAQALRDDPFRAFEFIRSQRDVRTAIDSGHMMWTASPQLYQRFLRPLSSLSHWLDFYLLRASPVWMHLENLLLFAVLILVAASVLRQTLGTGFTAGLAALLYAVNPAQSATVGWISGRNTLLGAVFGMSAFALHVRARTAPRGGPYTLGGLLLMAAGLLSSEGALAALALIGAYALTLDRDGPRRGVLRALPSGLLALAYVGTRHALGYGARATGFYVDVSDPAALVTGIAQAVPTYLASQLTVSYATFSALLPHGPTWIALASALLCVALVPLFLPLLRSDARARFCLLAAMLSAVVLGGAVPQDRLVFFVGLGAAGLIALRVTAPDQRRWARMVSGGLLRVHAVYATLLFVPLSFTQARGAVTGGATRALDSALPHDLDASVVLLNAPNELPLPWLRAQRGFEQRPYPRNVQLLYAGLAPVHVRAPDLHTLELTVDRGWLATPLERISNAAPSFVVSQVVEVSHMRAEVLETTSEATPRSVRFVFDQPLDRLVLLSFIDGSVARWTPPPPGMTDELPALSAF